MRNPINKIGKNNFVSSAYCTLEAAYETFIFENYMGLKDPNPIKTKPSDMYFGAIRIIEGSCNLIADGTTYHLVKDDLLFVKYFRGFRFVSNFESCKYFFYWFYLSNITLPYYQIFNMPFFEEEKDYSYRIIRLLQQENYESSHIANAYMQILIFSWLKSIASSEKGKTSQLFEDIKNYINSNLSVKLTINDIADHFYFSTKYINVIFNKSIGISPKKYITKMVMDKAIFFLNKTDLGISQIAYELGFDNVSSFSSAFKKYFHTNPTAYKKTQSLTPTS